MEDHLEREICFSEVSEYKNLYPWSLHEVDENGEIFGSQQVPWEWSLYFIASDLQHIRSIGTEPLDDKEKITIQEKETITAILHSGLCRDGKTLEDDVSYSMFGTSRNIKDFVLRIKKLEDGSAKEEGLCHLWGCVSYTSEVDFSDETTDDILEINIWLSPERFNNIAKIIGSKSVDIVQLSLRNVSGFYSEWSPSISTYRVKVLTGTHKVSIPEKCKVIPPRLGEVGEFNLSFVQRNKLNPKQDLRGIDIDDLFQDEDEYDEIEDDLDDDLSQNPDSNTLIFDQLVRNELALDKIKTPLWLILIALVLLSLNLVYS